MISKVPEEEEEMFSSPPGTEIEIEFNSTGRGAPMEPHESLVGPHPTITKVECVFRIKRDEAHVRNVFRIVKVGQRSLLPLSKFRDKSKFDQKLNLVFSNAL